MSIELPTTPSTVGSGNRALADFQRRLREAESRIAARQVESQELQHGLDLGRTDLGGNGVQNYIPLTSVADDERFFQLCQQDPLLTAYFGGGVKAAAPVAPAVTSVEGLVGSVTEAKGLLSNLTRYPFLRWLNSRGGVLISVGVLGVAGLLCVITLIGSLSRPPTTVVAQETEESTTPLPVVLEGGMGATVTAQAGQLTALANRSTSPVATTLPTTPSPTATPDYSLDPHAGLLPPAKLAAPALSLSNDKLRRFQSSQDGQSLVSVPPRGVIYHFGAYPGERPGNVVLVADYETLGTWLEVFQVNDLVQVIDRNGGTYTYKILPWDLVTAQAEQSNQTQTAVPAIVSGLGQQYQEATAVARIPYEVEKITTWQDVSLAATPNNPTLSILTLVALGKTGENPGNRYAVRARFVSYNPASNLPPGTPVPLSPTPGASTTPSITPR